MHLKMAVFIHEVPYLNGSKCAKWLLRADEANYLDMTLSF